MYAALRLELPAAVGPDQRDRNDLLIVSDMFQVRERRVELGHIEVGVIADFAKPVVPVLLRRDDEVVFIVLAEQIVGVLMLLQIIYDALDLNSHFKLFQLVSRRGFGRGLGLAAFDFNVSINAVRAANQVPRAILPPPFDVGFLVWLRIGVGFADILIELRNVFRSVQFDGIEVCSFDRLHAEVFVCIGQDAIALLVRIMLGRPLDALHTNIDILIFKVRLRVVGRVRGHFMRGFDPRVRCRFHPRLTIFIIGEVERDGRRGLGVLYLPDQIAGLLHEPCRPDSHWADISARAIAYDLADRMLCVGRVSERILYHIMRSGCRNADNIYNNAGHVVFRGLGGLVDGRGLRLPDSIQRGGSGHNDAAAGLIGRRSSSGIGAPTLEVIVHTGGSLVGNGEGGRTGLALRSLRGRYVGNAISVAIVVQGVRHFWIGVLRYEINRSALVAGGRTALVKRPHCGICIGFFRPTDDLVTAVDTCTISCCLDVTDGDCVIVICRVAMIRRVLANKLRLFRRTIIVANIEFVTHIQDSESNIDLMSCIQLRQCVERQQGQCHYKHQNPRQQPLSCFLSSHKKIPPSFGRNTAHRRGSMNASATGCHAVRGHRLGSWLCDTGFRRLCLLSAHLLVSVSRTAYD